MSSPRWRRTAAAAVALSTAGLAASATEAAAATTTVVDTTSAWNGSSGIGPFGDPDTATYGQVVTVPSPNSGLQSFTFQMQLPSTVVFRGEVYAWSGNHATGGALWESAPMHTAGTGGYEAVTFTPGGVPLVAGAQYVLFASTSKDPGSGTGRWGIAFAGYSGGSFVYLNNGSDPTRWTTYAWTALGSMDTAFTAVFVPGDTAPTVTGTPVTTVEGSAFSGTVATVADADHAMASDFTATVDWGDGTTATTGTTVDTANGVEVRGTHTYAEEGTYTVTTTVHDVDGGSSATGTSTATVADAPIALTGVSAVTPLAAHLAVAHLTDADPGGTAADFAATVDWGDGTAPDTTAAVQAAADGGFDVMGGHTYAGTGPFTVRVRACDAGGSCAAATSTLLVYGLPRGGAFVVGDRATSPVTYWADDWAHANPMSTGRAPDSFKGFENSAASPVCGTTWTAASGDGGGDGARTRTVPAYMAVVVADSVVRVHHDRGHGEDDGGGISGDTVHVVVVRTDPSHGDAGDAALGTVVATVC